MPLHELRHVDFDQMVFRAEHELSERLGQQGLTDSGRAKEDERADRAARVFQTGAGATHGFGKHRDRFFLADDPLVEGSFHLEQSLGLFARDPHHRNAGPHRHHFGNIFLGDIDLFFSPVVFHFLLLSIDLIAKLVLAIPQLGGKLEILRADGGFKIAVQRFETGLGILYFGVS